MFTAIARDETALGRPVTAATLHRIHATLRRRRPHVGFCSLHVRMCC